MSHNSVQSTVTEAAQPLNWPRLTGSLQPVWLIAWCPGAQLIDFTYTTVYTRQEVRLKSVDHDKLKIFKNFKYESVLLNRLVAHQSQLGGCFWLFPPQMFWDGGDLWMVLCHAMNISWIVGKLKLYLILGGGGDLQISGGYRISPRCPP